MTEIRAPDVLVVLHRIEAKGNHETAVRLRATVGAVFRHAIATTRADVDPTQALRGALVRPRVTHRAAATDAKDLGAPLRAIDGLDGRSGCERPGARDRGVRHTAEAARPRGAGG